MTTSNTDGFTLSHNVANFLLFELSYILRGEVLCRDGKGFGAERGALLENMPLYTLENDLRPKAESLLAYDDFASTMDLCMLLTPLAVSHNGDIHSVLLSEEPVSSYQSVFNQGYRCGVDGLTKRAA